MDARINDGELHARVKFLELTLTSVQERIRWIEQHKDPEIATLKVLAERLKERHDELRTECAEKLQQKVDFKKFEQLEDQRIVSIEGQLNTLNQFKSKVLFITTGASTLMALIGGAVLNYVLKLVLGG